MKMPASLSSAPRISTLPIWRARIMIAASRTDALAVSVARFWSRTTSGTSLRSIVWLLLSAGKRVAHRVGGQNWRIEARPPWYGATEGFDRGAEGDTSR